MGLDPLSNRLRKQAARARAKKPVRLNPEFPFRPEPFDPEFFAVMTEPPVTIDSRRPA